MTSQIFAPEPLLISWAPNVWIEGSELYSSEISIIDIPDLTLWQKLDRGISQNDLLDAMEERGNLIKNYAFLWYLWQNNLLQMIWRKDDQDLAIFQPLSANFSWQILLPHLPSQPQTISRFAYLHWEQGNTILDSGETQCRIVLLDRRLHALSHVPNSEPLMSEFFQLLSQAGFLEPLAESHSRACWQFHDALFNANAKAVTKDHYRFYDKFPSLPAIKPPKSENLIPLPSVLPDPGDSLFKVIEKRRSIRQQASAPITITQLSSLLYYALRIKKQISASETNPQDLLLRTYPSGGAIYELEFYLAVGNCQGLDSGFYRYEGLQHSLEPILQGAEAVKIPIEEAGRMWIAPIPQVVILIVSRFPRLAWKYSDIAYRLTLMNSGAAIQTMYLVATQLELACSALGAVNVNWFNQVTGEDIWSETPIAQFALGSKGLVDKGKYD